MNVGALCQTMGDAFYGVAAPQRGRRLYGVISWRARPVLPPAPLTHMT